MQTGVKHLPLALKTLKIASHMRLLLQNTYTKTMLAQQSGTH